MTRLHDVISRYLSNRLLPSSYLKPSKPAADEKPPIDQGMAPHTCGPKGSWQLVPKSQIVKMCLLFITQHFGLRGCQEHHDMFVEDFSFSKDDNGVEYVKYEENPSKTRQGGAPKKRIVVEPKMFATGGWRCSVKLIKTFLSHRPEDTEKQWTILPCSDWAPEVAIVVVSDREWGSTALSPSWNLWLFNGDWR